MTVSRPTYVTREEVKQALDIKVTARSDLQIDMAIEAASDSVDGFLHRTFYPMIATRYIDWPNYQYAYPWKVYLDAAEIADATGNVPVVTTGGVVIPAGQIFWEPINYAPPYTYFELNRSTNAAFGVGPTPQRDVAITGTFGYWVKTTPAGTLAAAMTDTTGTIATVTNGAAAGVGDNILIGAERLLVTDKAMASTGQTQQSGLTSANNADVTLGVTDGTKYSMYETLLLDSERVLVVDIAGNAVTVKRAWDGTVLAAHTSATIYGLRQWTVTRGDLGTTAATHLTAAPIGRAVVPGLVRQLALAEAEVAAVLGQAAYATVQGSTPGAQTSIGSGVPDVRNRCYAKFGRKARSRAV
jgi:hypothetical protein